MRFLTAYSALLTAALTCVLLTGAKSKTEISPDEITVHRINVVEPDGTLRMVISNHARLPGIITRGKEQKFDRPQAGMIFITMRGPRTADSFSEGTRMGRVKSSTPAAASRSTNTTRIRSCS